MVGFGKVGGGESRGRAGIVGAGMQGGMACGALEPQGGGTAETTGAAQLLGGTSNACHFVQIHLPQREG